MSDDPGAKDRRSVVVKWLEGIRSGEIAGGPG
ncbi:MAG: hypothetical protein XD74_1173 [Actinobacteria bacterium 66_15]|jgi:hypothetical protein|nr:MAG: hypothetical protein XD74_1173 [Actinobacteria bacterium 66_15]